MKPRLSFTEHLENQDKSAPIQESLLSKGYAISQNSQHNSATQKINALTNKIASLSRDAKQEDDTDKKLDKLCDAVFAMSELFKTQSLQSTAIKNVLVADALFAQEKASIKRT
jgi:hypothetical protein